MRTSNLVSASKTFKQLWRYALQNNSLWRVIIQSKYGELEGATLEMSEAFGIGLWKAIRRE